MKWVLLAGLIILVIGIGVAFLLFGETEPAPFPELNPELHCEVDDDCTHQETSCNNCGCPEPSNKDTVVDLNCRPSTGGCALYCAPTIPRCVNNECQLIEVTPEEFVEWSKRNSNP